MNGVGELVGTGQTMRMGGSLLPDVSTPANPTIFITVNVAISAQFVSRAERPMTVHDPHLVPAVMTLLTTVGSPGTPLVMTSQITPKSHELVRLKLAGSHTQVNVSFSAMSTLTTLKATLDSAVDVFVHPSDQLTVNVIVPAPQLVGAKIAGKIEPFVDHGPTVAVHATLKTLGEMTLVIGSGQPTVQESPHEFVQTIVVI